MAVVRCALCNQPLRVAESAVAGTCVSCREQNVVAAFPALIKEETPKPPSLPVDPPGPGEAACYYSPNRRATKECSHCGVLISDTWAAQWGNETVCLKCLEHLRTQNRDERFQSRRVLWDNIVLALALAPFTLILWFMVFLSAPAALILGMFHWNSPRSLVPRTRMRLVIGMLLATVESVLAAIFVYEMIKRRFA